MEDDPPLEIRFGASHLTRPIAEIYYQAFGRKVALLKGSARTAVPILEASLHPELALVALERGVVVGIAALEEPCERFLTIERSVMRRALGIRALIKAPIVQMLRPACYPGELHLNALAVRQDRRGRGIGTRLLEETCCVARERGLGAIRLEVVDTNPRAKKLYEAVGFQVVGMERFWLARPFAGFSAVYSMVKPLA